MGYDSSVKFKREMLGEILSCLNDSNLLSKRYDNMQELLDLCLDSDKDINLDSAQIMDVIEFSRTVHAEMAAISDAAKRGVSVKGSVLYCTTFPCHLCAKHIVASGIEKVIYIQPYPKSQVKSLYEDSIEIDPGDDKKIEQMVIFVPFQGIAPTLFKRLFEHKRKRKDSKTGKILQWTKSESIPRIQAWEGAHIDKEDKIVADILPKVLPSELSL